MKTYLGVLSLSVLLLGLVACQKTSSTDIEETGQQIGEVMASIDESGGSGGSIARDEEVPNYEKTFDRLAGLTLWDKGYEFLVPTANAATCLTGSTFSSCLGNVITRTFNDCTIGGATLSGTVTLTWGGTSASCVMAAAADTVTRSPSFTLTGRRGATLTVSKTGSFGQRLTWSSGTGTSRILSFTNDGIRRVFTTSEGTVLFDFTTTTTDAITVTGTLRSNRVLSGGTLKVVNNLTNVSCSYVPTSVTWTSTCTCASSGTWEGTCTDGKTTNLTISGCGTASLTIGTDTQAFSFDRCYGT